MIDQDWVKQVFGKTDAPRFAGVSVSRVEHETEAAMRASLGARLQGAQGWVCSRSETPSRWNGTWPMSELLSGEWSLGERVSVHVRFSEGRWVVFTYEEQSEPADCVIWEECVLSNLARGSGRAHLKMVYDTCWREEPDVDDVRVFRPWLSRFKGWRE